ncbi:NYN domain-containing protein [Sporosalibacterium faouarense]|uniref:NYN domain-containing protein n=1 Tax=Sporosalibacterium faouarense TaxID=516123 RepID=UPI00141CEB6F|nr:NYN domain-containing protein [Sporosalibacterium faouarense]MTI48355.1 NYN domain-containing protein [Bacillota bacterium]
MKAQTKEFLFVDGYNIINAWDNLRDLSKISLETARNELIDIMAEYQAYTGITVIIVYDAHLVKGSSEKKEKYKEVEVVYTKENETADQYIEKILDSLGKRKKIRVATSDWVEQQIVLGRGGTRISARELQLEIKSVKKRIERKNSTKNESNDMLMGRLDPEILKKLEKWGKNE